MPVISVEHLSKTYRLGQIGTPSESTRPFAALRMLREGELPAPSCATWNSGGRNCAASGGQPYALHPIRPLGRTVGEKDHGNRGGEELYALRDVSFAVAGSKVVVK